MATFCQTCPLEEVLQRCDMVLGGRELIVSSYTLLGFFSVCVSLCTALLVGVGSLFPLEALLL